MSLIRICAIAAIAAILCLAVQPSIAAPFLTDSSGQGVSQLLRLAQATDQAKDPAKDQVKDDADDDDDDDEDDDDDDDDDDGDDKSAGAPATPAPASK